MRPAQKEELQITESFFEPDDLPAGAIISSTRELEKALSHGKAGEVMILKSGEYDLNFEINQDIIIYGQGSSTVIKPADSELPVIRAAGTSITLKNLVIKDARIGVSVIGGKVSLEKVKFINLKGMAVWAEGSELDMVDSYIYGSGQGIGAMNSSGLIKNCIIENNIKSGVELWNSEFSIKGNIIEGNGSYGLFADAGSDVEIEGNYVEGNKGFNVRIEGKQEIYR